MVRDLEGGNGRLREAVTCNGGGGDKIVVGPRGAIGRKIIVKEWSFSLQLFGEFGLDGRQGSILPAILGLEACKS